jgi:solute:Na+ symporter, SSS family
MTSGQSLDLTLVIVYLLAISGYGIWAGRKESGTTEGYFLGGRKFGWFAVGASLFATNISITQFMSAGGLAHDIGLASINNDLVGGLLLAVSALCFVPIYIRSRLFTMPEFLERRYSKGSRQIFGWVYLIQSILQQPSGYYIGALAVLGLFNLSPDYLPLACIVIGATIGTYAVIGGLTSVVRTDVLQVVLLIGGGLAVTYFGLGKAGGWSMLREEFGATHFELLLPRGTAMPWTALLGIALHSCYFAFCSIHILQRVLGAKDEYNARMGMLFSGWLKFLAIPLFAIPGIVAMKLYPDSMGDATYAMMVRDLLPAGLSGLVMAGMIAALMSSADSNVNAMSSVVAMDIYPSLAKKPNERTALKLGKWTSASIVAFGVLVAPYYQHLGGIYLFILRLGGFLLMPVGVCFILGRFSKRVNQHGALACLGVGSLLGLAYVLFTSMPPLKPLLPEWFLAMHFYEVLPFFFLFNGAVLFGVSWLTPAPTEAQLAVLAEKGPNDITGAENRPIWQSFDLWFGLFCGALGLTYIAF